MIERVAVVLILAVAAVIAYRLFCRIHLTRANAAIQIDPLLHNQQRGHPAIVFFSTPTCVPCRTQQKPALDALKADTNIDIIHIDATQQPDAAERWGVFSVPTTFIIAPNGKPHAVNHGVADLATLRRQIADAAHG